MLYCARISLGEKQVSALQIRTGRKDNIWEKRPSIFVVKQKAIPEVLLKVVEAKRLLESEKVLTIQGKRLMR